MRVSGADTNLGVGHLKLKNRGYGDMDAYLNKGTGVRYTIIFRKYFQDRLNSLINRNWQFIVLEFMIL